MTITIHKGYYNKAIAASPVHALPGYIIGGLAWFAIPWLCATTMGLSALALEGTPAFPTYPDRMLPADITAGLVLPYAAIGLLGRSGAICTLIMIFSKMMLPSLGARMIVTETDCHVAVAVTSAFSAQLIAVSSIVTYDIYQSVAS